MNKLKTTALAVIAVGLVVGISSAQVTTSSCYQFERNLRVGNTGADVKALQQTLNANGFTVAAAGHAGSAGMETTYFGNATKMALIKWQEANAATTLAPWGLTSGTGFFGATSRAEMNKCAPGTPTTPGTGTVSGAVSVSLASVQPNNVLVEKSSHAKLADFNFSGTGIVTGVKLQRTGVSNNNTLTNVYLYEGNTRISDAASVLADGTINFNYGTGLFSVTGSKTISVYADIAATSSGQSVGVALIGYTVSGSAPAVVAGLNGPNLPIGSAIVVSATVATTSTQTTADVGNQNVNVWAGTIYLDRDAYLVGGNFKMIGSAPTSALTNVKLYIDGVQVGNATMVDSMGRISFSGNTFLRSGLHTINVRGDIADGAGRSFYIVLEQGSDLLIQDAQLAGVYSMPTVGMSQPLFNLKSGSGDVMISSCTTGCVILSPDSSFTAQRATVGGSNQTIGKFTLTALGEPVKLMSGTLDIVGSAGSSTENVSNVTVYVNGMAVTSGASDILTASTLTLNNMGGIIVNPGSPVTIEVKADLRTTAGANIQAQTLTVNLNNLQVQGQQSRNTQTISQVSNLVTVGASDANFSKNAAFSGSSITTTQQGVKIGSYTMSAGQNEGVTVTQIDLTLAPGTTGINLGNMSNLVLKDETGAILGQRGTIGSGTSSVTLPFSLYQSINSNTSKTFEFYADFVNATGTITSTAKGYYQGSVSNTIANNTAAAATTTVGVSGINPSANLISSQSQAAQYVVGGTVSPVASFEFKASDSDVTANTIEVVVSNPAAVSGVTIDGNVAVSNGNGRYTASVNKVITKLGTIIPVGVTFVQADTNNNLSNATTSVGVAYIGTNTNGATFGTQGTTTASVSSNVFTSAISIPTAVKAAGVYLGAGNQSGIKLGTLTITAASNGAIKLSKASVTVGAPSGTATSSSLRVNGTSVAAIVGGVATFSGDYIISAGQTVTFDVYGDADVSGTAGNTSVNPGTTFEWSDLTSNTFTSTALIKNYGN